ncbi:MAG TPA: aminoglycoside phosphotransferase family protein [Anaerolineales bacterium]|nr:aminoglycoside phosphotransferase family protein [Anaerolineales bacterium]
MEFNLYGIEAELRIVFPALSIPSPLQIIGSGFNSLVVEAGGAIIFRIGKNSVAQSGYEKEIRCLSVIAPHIPFLIPDPKWYIKRSAYFPFGLIGYDKIPGFPLQPNLRNDTNLSLLASDSAKFLLALHRIPPDSVPLQPISNHTSRWKAQYQEVLSFLKAELVPTEFNLIQQWWDDFLSDQEMQKYNPVIQHGDLWYENMLVDTRMEKLIGIIDGNSFPLATPPRILLPFFT